MLRPHVHSSPVLTRQLEVVANQELSAISETSLSDLVGVILRARIQSGVCDVASVAADRHMSQRTFQRRLNGEGMSFRAVLDAARRDLCLELIEAGMAPTRVASRAAFSDVRAFRRAFRRWTGSRPQSTVGSLSNETSSTVTAAAHASQLRTGERGAPQLR